MWAVLSYPRFFLFVIEVSFNLRVDRPLVRFAKTTEM